MNNMTGDPNQENRPSVFGFEPYPSLNVHPIDWSRIPIQSPVPPLIPPGQFNPSLSYQQSSLGVGSFSFCTGQTPLPAQFPFPPVSTPIVENNVFGNSHFTSSSTVSVGCKRKTDSPTLQVCKQHITEEKMAEHMSKLHISSETATSSKESDSDRTKRLYMCEEMRKLQSDTILPQSLLSKIQRPCTALVLWKPPRPLIPLQNNDNDNGNNNEESVPDHNRMASEDSVMENDVIDVNNMEFDL